MCSVKSTSQPRTAAAVLQKMNFILLLMHLGTLLRYRVLAEKSARLFNVGFCTAVGFASEISLVE